VLTETKWGAFFEEKIDLSLFTSLSLGFQEPHSLECVKCVALRIQDKILLVGTVGWWYGKK